MKKTTRRSLALALCLALFLSLLTGCAAKALQSAPAEETAAETPAPAATAAPAEEPGEPAPEEGKTFYDPEEQLLKASDIPLKPRESGFSTPLVLKKGWQILKGIEECRIVDTPEGADLEVHSDIERLNLFGEEEG